MGLTAEPAPLPGPPAPRGADADLLLGAPVGFAQYDADLRYVRINELLAAANGRSVAEHLGRHVREVLRGPVAEAVEAAAERVLTTGLPVSGLTVSGVTADGAASTWTTTWFPVRDAAGTVTGAAVLALDVTGLQAVEAELQRSEARYRSLVEVAALDVFHCDAQGRLLGDMPGWRGITGQDVPSLLGDGWGWQEALHPDDRARVAAIWDTAVRTRTPYRADYRILAPDGTPSSIVARAVPVVEDGVVTEWVGAVEDVTAEREASRARDAYAAAAAAAASRTARLQEATAALASAVTADDVAAVVVGQARDALGARGGGLCVVDEAAGLLRGLRLEGYAGLDSWTEPLDGDDVCAHVVRTGRPLFLPDLEALAASVPLSPNARAGAGAGDRAWAAVPLTTSGRPVGALALAFDTERALDADEQVFLVALGAQAGQALERAGLYDRLVEEAAQARAASARLEVLARATAAVHEALDVERALTALAEVVVPAFADVVSVGLVDTPDGGAPGRDPGDGVPLRTVAVVTRDGLPPPPPGTFDGLRPRPESPVGRALATGEVVLEPLAAARGRVRAVGTLAWGEQVGGRSLLVVPLRPPAAAGDPAGSPAGSPALGVLLLLATDDRPAWTDEDVVLAQELAARGGAALAHALSFRRSRQVALTLQRSLLPATGARISEQLDELVVASRYVPGVRDTEVGGDWYDVVELGAGRVALVIGDVMGRGVRAAAVMGQLRSAVRAYARQDLPPAELAALLDGLVADLDEAQIVTMVYAVWDPGRGELVVANAGHPAPLVRRPDGRVVPVQGGEGTPLGVGAGVFTATTVPLAPGSLLALCTDGLLESREQGVDEGLQRLAGVLADPALGTAEDLEAAADRVLSGMGRDGGHDDDTALLLVRVPPGAEEDRTARLALPAGTSGVREARDLVVGALTRWGAAPDVVDAARLVVSEVATNALLHGRPPVEVRVNRGARRFVVEVGDGSPHGPHRRRAADDDEGGRGLALVAACTERWGVRQTDTGKTVWFELAR